MKTIAAILVSLLVVACSSTPKISPSSDSKLTGVHGNTSSSTASADTHGVSGSAKMNEAQSEAQSKANEAASKLQNAENKSVYFDFDSFAILPAYRDVIMQQSNVIKEHSNEVVTLEGNADERGSRAYNLALGERRASAVQKSLKIMGIPASKMKVALFRSVFAARMAATIRFPNQMKLTAREKRPCSRKTATR